MLSNDNEVLKPNNAAYNWLPMKNSGFPLASVHKGNTKGKMPVIKKASTR